MNNSPIIVVWAMIAVLFYIILSSTHDAHSQVMPLPTAQAEKDISMLEVRKPELTDRTQDTLDRLLFRDLLQKLKQDVVQGITIAHQGCREELK